MRIYYTAMDCGDGSLHVRFFDDQRCIDLLEEHMPETYRGEGGSYFDCDNFSANVDTLKEVLEEIME